MKDESRAPRPTSSSFRLHPSSLVPLLASADAGVPHSAPVFYSFFIVVRGRWIQFPAMLVTTPFLFSDFQLLVVGVSDSHRRRRFLGVILAGSWLAPCRCLVSLRLGHVPLRVDVAAGRSEEHTSELQSPDHLVCRLLLEKKKKRKIRKNCRHETVFPFSR